MIAPIGRGLRMNFGFTDEQELLRSEVRKFLDEKAPLDEVRRVSEDESGLGYDTDLWARIAELGWTGLAIPEAYGGVGLGWVDLVVLLEETGRSLFPAPLVATTLAADAIARAGGEAQRARFLPGLADGSVIGSVALVEENDTPDPTGIQFAARPSGKGLILSGEKLFVQNAAAADLFVVAFRREGELALAVVEKSQVGVSAEDWPGIDLTKRLGRLRLENVEVAADAILEAGDSASVAMLFDTGATAIAAEAIGAAEAALALTTAYAKERVQFGRPIGTFQGVKHPLAEMYVDVESFKSLTYYAAWCIDEGHADLSLAASRAKAYASEAIPRIGIDAVQLHGGIGYTWEYDAHLFLKRAKWVRPIFGDADHHYERVAALGGL
ncbi:MAG: acyl-CoA/acyl-ACP dehydrogenase [bacterium]|nr:acyl-CoA/acyl-ACP dehydrogenase [bacterium]